MNNQTITPSRWYYVLAVCVFFSGFAIALALSALNILSASKTASTRVVVPGSKDINLSDTGDYTIFYEYKSTIDGKPYETEKLPSLQCLMTSKATGAKVPISPSNGTHTYSSSSGVERHEGRGIMDFKINKPGTYQLDCTSKERVEKKVVLLIDNGSTLATILITVFGSVGIIFGSALAALIIGIVTFVRRQSAKNRLAAPIQ